MATPVRTTRNLKLKITSDLTADARSNLEKIDTLGSLYNVDTNNDAIIRSTHDIHLLPESNDVGGQGIGGIVNVGAPGQNVGAFNVFADEVNISITGVSLADRAATSVSKLSLQYNSEFAGTPDLLTDRVLTFDLEGANRALVLGGSFSLLGGDLELTASTPNSVLTLPALGTLATLAAPEVFLNKTIDASLNDLINISNVNVALGAAIDGQKILSTFGAQPVTTTDSFRLSNGVFDTYLKQASSGQTSTIGWELPPTDGTAAQVLSTNGAGKLGWASPSAGQLSGLTDTNISGPTDGQVLTYNAGTSKWINHTSTGGGSVSFQTFSWVPADGLTKTITHNFGTYNILVEIFDENHVIIGVGDISLVSTNAAMLTTSDLPPLAGWTVLIQALT